MMNSEKSARGSRGHWPRGRTVEEGAVRKRATDEPEYVKNFEKERDVGDIIDYIKTRFRFPLRRRARTRQYAATPGECGGVCATGVCASALRLHSFAHTTDAALPGPSSLSLSPLSLAVHALTTISPVMASPADVDASWVHRGPHHHLVNSAFKKILRALMDLSRR